MGDIFIDSDMLKKEWMKFIQMQIKRAELEVNNLEAKLAGYVDWFCVKKKERERNSSLRLDGEDSLSLVPSLNTQQNIL